MNATKTFSYPLGTDRQELDRLHLQHRLWSDAAHAAWRRAGIVPGSRVLDVGAGPGAASYDLAELVSETGHVLAIDESAAFVDHIRAQASARGLTQLSASVGDAHDLAALPNAVKNSFDLAWARWLLCFSSRPQDVVRGVADLLKPGCAFVVHDYFNYEAMTLAPRRASYARVVAATAKSWRDNGGDPDVVARLPRIFEEQGFDVVHLDVHQRVARPGDTMWHWTLSWWRSYTHRLVTMGYLTTEQERTFHSDLDGATRAHDFIVLPPVFEVVAKKRG